jgi:glycosyltransferase involved in cell wall biosynthesis
MEALDTITLITTTGNRPEAFNQCIEYMRRQTYTGPIQWIVVSDDNLDAIENYDKFRGIRPATSMQIVSGPKKWRRGINTQRLNLDAAISLCEGKYVFIIEDDDWYHPSYLDAYVALLHQFRIVGEVNAKYYNLRNKTWREMKNYSHASLCQTAFHRSLLPMFEEAVNSGDIYIDIQLWKYAADLGINRGFFSDTGLAVGIKGMPGRNNIGVGGKAENFIPDGNGEKLKEWVGKDYDFYKQFLGRSS